MKHHDPDSPWLTPAEAAARLKIGRTYFDQIAKEHNLKRYRIGNGKRAPIRYHYTDVDTLAFPEGGTTPSQSAQRTTGLRPLKRGKK